MNCCIDAEHSHSEGTENSRGGNGQRSVAPSTPLADNLSTDSQLGTAQCFQDAAYIYSHQC